MTKSTSKNCRQYISLEEILSKTKIQSDGCMIWQMTRLKNGYGQIWLRGTMILTHREVCRLTHGEPKDGEMALHSCDNPSCVNPSHLSWGTHSENMKQMYARNRAPKRNPFKHGVFTKNDVLNIRAQKLNGMTTDELSVIYKVSTRTINKIVSKETYKDI